MRNAIILFMFASIGCATKTSRSAATSDVIFGLPLPTMACTEEGQTKEISIIMNEASRILNVDKAEGRDAYTLKPMEYALSYGSNSDVVDINDELNNRKFTCNPELTLDYSEASTQEAFHLTTSRGFARSNWCGFYGNNLDAFEECLVDLPNQTRLNLMGWEKVKKASGEITDFGVILGDIMKDLQEMRKDLVITIR